MKPLSERPASYPAGRAGTGTVELYQGKPEIKVTSMSQIKGADSQPVSQ
jgi:hypothetical protein